MNTIFNDNGNDKVKLSRKLIIAACVVAFIIFALHPPARGQQGVVTVFTQFTITNGHTVSTNFLTGTNIKAMKVTLIGLQAGGVSNAAAVFVGPSSNVYYNIGPGERHIIETQPGTFIFLNSWWLRTPTANDGLTVIYQ